MPMEIQILIKYGSQANMSKHIMLCQRKSYRVPGDAPADLIRRVLFLLPEILSPNIIEKKSDDKFHDKF
jgi:hypothetical protein